MKIGSGSCYIRYLQDEEDGDWASLTKFIKAENDYCVVNDWTFESDEITYEDATWYNFTEEEWVAGTLVSNEQYQIWVDMVDSCRKNFDKLLKKHKAPLNRDLKPDDYVFCNDCVHHIISIDGEKIICDTISVGRFGIQFDLSIEEVCRPDLLKQSAELVTEEVFLHVRAKSRQICLQIMAEIKDLVSKIEIM